MIFKKGFFQRFQKKTWLIFMLFLLQIVWMNGGNVDAAEEEKPTRYKIIDWKWDELKIPLTVAAWILVACVAKISKFHIFFAEIDNEKLILS